MVAFSPPSVAPDLHESLTSNTWETYRQTINRWWRDWDAIDENDYRDILSDRTSESAQILLQTFAHHREYKGNSHIEVILGLRRSARHAQGLYKLRIKYPKPGPADDVDKRETVAAHVATIDWGFFGGGDWRVMSAPQVAALGRELRTLSKSEDLGDRGHRIEIDHDSLAMNRFGYLLHQEMAYELGKPDKTGLGEYIRELEETVRYPNETNIAQWVRHSRTKAAGLAAVAILVGAFTGIAGLTLLGGIFAIYFVLSFIVYPWLLGSA